MTEISKQADDIIRLATMVDGDADAAADLEREMARLDASAMMMLHMVYRLLGNNPHSCSSDNPATIALARSSRRRSARRSGQRRKMRRAERLSCSIRRRANDRRRARSVALLPLW